MIINGVNFGTDKSLITVHLNNQSGQIYSMKVLQVSADKIKVGIPGGLPGVFDVSVQVGTDGYAKVNPPNANQFTYEVVIDSISPVTGSHFGGTLLTIQGRNFPTDKLQNLVFLGNQINWMCTLQAVSSTEIKCRTPTTHSDWTSPTQTLTHLSRIIIESTCTNCDYTYLSTDESPSITSLSANKLSSGQLTITGTKFTIGNTVEVVFKNKITQKETVVNVDSTSTDTAIDVTLPSL